MQAVSTVSGGVGLERRFRPAGALATHLVTEEYRSQHLRGQPLYAPQPRSSRGPAATASAPTPMPFDDNVHNRFHRQKDPLRNPLVVNAAPIVPPAASTPAPAAHHQHPHQWPCRSARTPVTPQEPRRPPKRCGCGPEDNGRKGVLGARLRKQQQQQQQQQQQGEGSAWRAQVKREERRAARSKGPGKKLGRQPPAGAGAEFTAFRRAYEEGRLPCSILHHPMGGARGNMVKWHVPPESLDVRVHLPLFLTGLLETKNPHRFLAIQGTLDLIKACKEQLPASLPHILPPLKTALAASDPIITATALKILQDLVLVDALRVGPALAPHYHSLLGAGAVFQRHKDATQGGGQGRDAMDYSQLRRLCLRRLVNETLELLELTGGPPAFLHIRYMIPTYERTVHAF